MARGVLNLVKALVDAKAQLSVANKAGATPTHAGANNGNVSCLERALKGGANPNAQDGEGNTPLVRVHARAPPPPRRRRHALAWHRGRGGAAATLLTGVPARRSRSTSRRAAASRRWCAASCRTELTPR